MSDRISLSTDKCECGLEYHTLEEIEGRAEDILGTPAAAGATVSVHPNVFHLVLEPLPVREWRVVQEQPDRVRVSLVGSTDGIDLTALEAALISALEKADVLRPRVDIERVAEADRTAVGKARLITRLA